MYEASAIAAISGDTVRAIKVTIVIPMKCPMSGIKPQTNTTRASADLYGRSRAKPSMKIKNKIQKKKKSLVMKKKQEVKLHNERTKATDT